VPAFGLAPPRFLCSHCRPWRGSCRRIPHARPVRTDVKRVGRDDGNSFDLDPLAAPPDSGDDRTRLHGRCEVAVSVVGPEPSHGRCDDAFAA
jgi:hypothetical protein